MTTFAYSLVMFDWQGTLADPEKYFTRYCIKTVKLLTGKSLPASTLSVLKQYHLSAIESWVHRVLPQVSPVLQQTVTMRLWEYCQNEATRVGLHPGVNELFQGLNEAGMLIAVVSSASRRYIQHALRLGGLASYVSFVRTPDDGPAKPSPALLQDVIAHSGLNPEQTVMVGDSFSDYLAAREAGVDFIGCHVVDERLQKEIESLCALFISIDGLQSYLLRPRPTVLRPQEA